MYVNQSLHQMTHRAAKLSDNHFGTNSQQCSLNLNLSHFPPFLSSQMFKNSLWFYSDSDFFPPLFFFSSHDEHHRPVQPLNSLFKNRLCNKAPLVTCSRIYWMTHFQTDLILLPQYGLPWLPTDITCTSLYQHFINFLPKGQNFYWFMILL